MVFGRKKKKEPDEGVVLLSDEEYDAEAELQKQLIDEKEYEVRILAEEEKKGAVREEKKLTVEDLLLKSEKIEGKLASFEEARGRIDDRIIRVSEQVGELRSMLLEKEKTFGVLESEFEMIQDVFEDIKPSEFSKELDKKEKSILQNQMHIEKLESMMEGLSLEISGFRKMLEKIKSFENLVDIANEVNEKVVTVEETGKYTQRMAAKTESIFSELNKQLMSMEDYKSKVESTNVLANEVVRSVDDLEVKLGNTVIKEELRDGLKDLEDSLIKKFGISKSLGEKVEGITKSVEIVEKRLRIMELDKVSVEVGEKIKELSPGLKQMRRIEQLTRERRDILELIETTGEEFKNKAISEQAYKEIKESNEKKLRELKAIIKDDLQSLQAALETELGPLISRDFRSLAKAKASQAGEKEAPTVSLDDRIDEEMKKMKGEVAGEEAGAEAGREVKPELGVKPESKVEVKPESEVEVEPEPKVEVEPAVEEKKAISPEELKKIGERLKLMETEEGVIQNLFKSLATSGMEEKKRLQREKKYAARLKKIAEDIAELRKLKESVRVTEAVAG